MRCELCGNEARQGERLWETTTRSPDGRVTTESVVHEGCVHNGQTRGQRIRVECDGTDFSRAYIYLIQPDNTQIPITSMVTACTIRIESNCLNTATISFEGVEVDVRGTTLNPMRVIEPSSTTLSEADLSAVSRRVVGALKTAAVDA